MPTRLGLISCQYLATTMFKLFFRIQITAAFTRYVFFIARLLKRFKFFLFLLLKLVFIITEHKYTLEMTFRSKPNCNASNDGCFLRLIMDNPIVAGFLMSIASVWNDFQVYPL